MSTISAGDNEINIDTAKVNGIQRGVINETTYSRGQVHDHCKTITWITRSTLCRTCAGFNIELESSQHALWHILLFVELECCRNDWYVRY